MERLAQRASSLLIAELRRERREKRVARDGRFGALERHARRGAATQQLTQNAPLPGDNAVRTQRGNGGGLVSARPLLETDGG